MLAALALLATLAGGCARDRDYGPTSPDYYPDFYPPYWTQNSTRAIDLQQKGAAPRSLPADDAIGQASSMRPGEKPFAGALNGGTDSSEVIDAIDFGNTRFCCYSDPRQ